MASTNPLRSDPELQSLTKKLEKIEKFKSFQRWQTKFLDRLDTFLTDKGSMEPATRTCTDFGKLLDRQLQFATKVSTHVEKGELGLEKKTIKAMLALSEMCKVLTQVVEQTQTLIPSTNRDEKASGFTKFHLGAALVQQGFTQYPRMKAIELFCHEIQQSCDGRFHEVADRQAIELLDYYILVFERFIDVIKDLGLHEVMLACERFQTPPDEEESTSVDPIIVHLTVQTEDGRQRIPLEIDSLETIGNVKEYIAPQCQIAKDRQVLTWNDNELADQEQTLQDLGILDAATFVVAPLRIPVTIRQPQLDPNDDHATFQVMVDPSKPLYELKDQVETRSGIAASNQILERTNDEGQRHVLDDRDEPQKAMEDYGIEAGTVLDLFPKTIHVNIETEDGATRSIPVGRLHGLQDIKNLIAKNTGIAPSKQVLKDSNGNELGDQNGDLCLRDGDTLKVGIFRIPITIRNTMASDDHDKEYNLWVDPEDPIEEIKNQLEPLCGLTVNNQRLFRDGTEWSDNDQTATNYGIAPNDVLDLEPKTIHVKVQNAETNTCHTVLLNLSDDLETIQEKVAKASKGSLPVSKQVLKHQTTGQELTSGESGATTAKDMGLRNGDALDASIYRIPVTVQTIDGQTLDVMVDPEDPVRELKRTLEPLCNLPVGNQRLFKGDKEWSDNDKTPCEYGCVANDCLELVPGTIHVTVRDTETGQSHRISISLDDNVDAIKEKIAEKTGMPAAKQLVRHNGQELQPGQTARDLGIGDEDSLEVSLYRIPVTVQTTQKGQPPVELWIDPDDPIGDMKRQLEPETGLALDNQRLFKNGEEWDDNDKSANDYGVQPNDVLDLEPANLTLSVETPIGQIVELTVKPSQSPVDIKRMIEEQTGLSVPEQVLQEKKTGQTLPDGKTLKELGVQPDDVLRVDIFTVPVLVNTPSGEQLEIQVNPHRPLSDIKETLQDPTGIAAADQRLLKEGTPLERDDQLAGDYGIQEGTVLDLESKHIAIDVETPDGQSHEVEIDPADTIAQVKNKIAQATGFRVPQQVLKHKGKELGDDGQTARDVGIRDGDTVKVDIFKVPVTVRMVDGNTFDIMVDPTGTVAEIKKLIEPQAGLASENQRLRKDSVELEDDHKSANDYSIKGGTIIDLEPKAIQVHVNTPNGGGPITVEVDPTANVEAIKREIEKQTGLTIPQQVLKDKDGIELKNQATAYTAGIKDGDTLDAEIFKIPIKVNTSDSEQLEILIDPTQPVEDIKRELEPVCGIPVVN